jgi:hypothetical protein
MNCEESRLHFAAALERQDEPPSPEWKAHLEGCAACREELDTLRTHWAALGLLGDAEPSSNLRRGFYHALEAYQDGLTQASTSKWWNAWWPRRPAFQAAFAVMLLVAGAGIGFLTARPAGQPAHEVAQLRTEIGTLRQLIALSMLQQQSAVDRLQGVTWAARTEPSDMEVLGALLRTINQDPSIDVRLAAVDALGEFANSPVARRGLTQSLAKQTSPLMQIAVIDVLVRIRERSAVGPIRELLADQNLNETVRLRAENALRRLE